MPFSFDQTENEDEQQIEALDECERLDIVEMFGDDDEQQEEIDSYSSSSALEHVEHVTVYSPETIVCDAANVHRNDSKRKSDSSQNGLSKPVKLIKIDVNMPKNSNGIDTTKAQHAKGKNELERRKRNSFRKGTTHGAFGGLNCFY